MEDSNDKGVTFIKKRKNVFISSHKNQNNFNNNINNNKSLKNPRRPTELEYTPDEPCCRDPKLILNNSSEFVCINCGTVLAPFLINSERRAYNASEISSRRRTEPLWRCFGNRTIIGSFNTDARGKQLQPNRRALFARLSKIQGSLINSLERNYWEAKPKLSTLSNRLAIPNFIQETAWSIYKIAAKKKLTMGRSIEGFIAASVYAAIRVHQYPRLLEEIVDFSLLPLRNIHKSLALIVREVLPELGLRYSPICSERLIFRFGNELKLSMPIQQKAKKLLFTARRAGLERTGKDPKGIAAATLYLAAKDTEEKRTQSNIAQIARITEVTLRTRAKQIWSYSQRRLRSKHVITTTTPKVPPSDIK